MPKISEKKLFLLVLLFALCVHGGGLFVMQHVPMGSSSFAMKKIHGKALITKERAQEWIVEPIEGAPITTSTVKEELQQLKPEFAPTVSLTNPKTEKLSLQEVSSSALWKTHTSSIDLPEK